MSDQPVYPYRESTDASTAPQQAVAPSAQQPQPYAQGQQPYSQGQPQAAPGQFPQAWGAMPPAGMTYPLGYGMVPPSNGLATFSMVAGIASCAFALLGYLFPVPAFFFIHMTGALTVVLVGLLGLRRSKMNGLKGPRAAAGIALGVFSIVTFLLLASSSVGGFRHIFDGTFQQAVEEAYEEDTDAEEEEEEEDEEDESGYGAGLVDLPDDVRDFLDGILWIGTYVSSDDSEIFVEFQPQSSSGSFDWIEQPVSGSQIGVEVIGDMTVEFGEQAAAAARAAGYSDDVIEEAQSMDDIFDSNYAYHDLIEVYIELHPTSDKSQIMAVDDPLVWYGYVASYSDVSSERHGVLQVLRPGPDIDSAEMFFPTE